MKTKNYTKKYTILSIPANLQIYFIQLLLLLLLIQMSGCVSEKVDLKRLELIASRGSATDLEVEHARLDVTIAQIYLDNLCLKSPIEGTIDKIDVEVSEAVKGVDNVVRVVKTDPLWIDVPLPLAESRTLKTGQKVEVKFLDYEKKSSEGTVIYISTAADAASSTLRVRIEVPNKSNRPSGEHVRVVFSNLEKT